MDPDLALAEGLTGKEEAPLTVVLPLDLPVGPGLRARKALQPGRRVLALYGRFLLTLVSVNRRPTAVLAPCLVFL